MIKSAGGRVEIDGTQVTLLTDLTMIIKALLTERVITVEDVEVCIINAQKSYEEVALDVMKLLESLSNEDYPEKCS